ncbi:MAG: DUF433 domain-containing protein [Ignavibacteriae bacterium]|nr:DUF433 domain-containing protein [Ignavibacteriota bacterium]
MNKELSTDELLARITVNPKLMLGKPTIRGFRMTVEHILEALAGGMSQSEILEEFPFLEVEDIQAALLYARSLVQEERIIELNR